MTTFKFSLKWLAAGQDRPEYVQTTADLALSIGNINLMQNEDIWSRTIRDSAIVSIYPLAMWLASSWWRLNWEPLPTPRYHPDIDWRMAHELGAANHGFVWPKIVLASDNDTMQVWAVASKSGMQQSIRYLNGTDGPLSVPMANFRRGAAELIDAVVNRLDAVSCQNTDLSSLWQLIREDEADPVSAKLRRIEALMGYDADECPDDLIQKALQLENRMGAATLAELAPIYGKPKNQAPLTAIDSITQGPGMTGAPTVSRNSESQASQSALPWQRAVDAARSLRQSLGNALNPIDDSMLANLLGLSTAEVVQWAPPVRNDAAIAMPIAENRYKIIPRKKHPIAKRFELARLLGDYLRKKDSDEEWLASTDLRTSRQKFQRAFAAEFLCPITALQDFLQNDYSESAMEDAAQRFEVSPTTVQSLLVNNHVIPTPFQFDYGDAGLPYQLGC